MSMPIFLSPHESPGVWLNGVLVPVNAAENQMTRFTTHLISITNHRTFPIQLVGSCTLLAHQDRYFVVACRHQIQNLPQERIGLITQDGEKAITSEGMAWVEGDGSSDHEDLIALDYTVPCNEGRLSKADFFPLTDATCATDYPDKAYYICVGFPFNDQSYDVADKLMLGSTKRIVPCRFDRLSHDPALFVMSTDRKLSFNPDGMSGGSSFRCVVRHDSSAHLQFAGIINRAGGVNIRAIRANVVRAFLNSAIAKSPG